MGLDIAVGFLSDLKQNDPEGFSEIKEEFERLNTALVAVGLKKHEEPEDLPESHWVSYQMWGYSGLHYLRRIAAYDALRLPLPSPGNENTDEDPVVDRYYLELDRSPGLFKRFFGARAGSELPFQHLMIHSDCEGYYVPQDFKNVIFPDESLEVAGAMIGSTQQLHSECRRLSELLEIPEGLDPESDDVWDAAETPSDSGELWQIYGIETFCCVRLLRACEISINTGSAIVFC
ncbi:MAG: hypothetical protein IPM63_15155 [Acidobacteriota bacterium]|nr:MAG: hypothetical protein IPM63_15155 [Acidobacteriota bacterium]